jgi:L-fuculose-phosphate aldolase
VRAREVAREIVRCCRSLWEVGLIAGADGNVSVRLARDRFLITPRGLLKSELSPDDLVEVDLTDLGSMGTATPRLN